MNDPIDSLVVAPVTPGKATAMTLITTIQRWSRGLWVALRGLGARNEQASLEAALGERDAALEEMRFRFDQSLVDVERQREGRERAELVTKDLQSALKRMMAEVEDARHAHDREHASSTQTGFALAPRVESGTPPRHLAQLAELRQRAETAERDAETLRELNGRLVDELEELKSELEHVRAESMRSGSRPSMRLDNVGGSHRPTSPGRGDDPSK